MDGKKKKRWKERGLASKPLPRKDKEIFSNLQNTQEKNKEREQENMNSTSNEIS